jgi:hypothetical protein
MAWLSVGVESLIDLLVTDCFWQKNGVSKSWSFSTE